MPIGSSCGARACGGVCITINSSFGVRAADELPPAPRRRLVRRQAGDDEAPLREQALRALGDVVGRAERHAGDPPGLVRAAASIRAAGGRSPRRRPRRPGSSAPAAPARRPPAPRRPVPRRRASPANSRRRACGEVSGRHLLGLVGGQRDARALRDVELRLRRVVAALRRADQAERSSRAEVEPLQDRRLLQSVGDGRWSIGRKASRTRALGGGAAAPRARPRAPARRQRRPPASASHYSS